MDQSILVWVRCSHFKRVALQFPPSLAWQAPALLSRLQICEPKIEWFVLGDTSYGDCCVDEVNAAHYGADCVVHFGFSCQTRPQRLPVLFVFPLSDSPPSLPPLQAALAAFVPSEGREVLVLCDPAFADFEFPVTAVLASKFRVNLAKLQHEFRPEISHTHISDHSFFRSPFPGRKKNPQISVCNRYVYSAYSGGALKIKEFPIIKSEISVLFVGPETSPLRQRLALEFPDLWELTPALQVSKISAGGRLMRRYAGVERVKEAQRVGVLYAASSLAEISRTREALSRLLRSRGKKVEGFCVGKLTEAKLGNFPEIECFVVLGCPEFINTEILPHAKNFHCPLVTAYEVLLACGVAEWDGTFSCNPEIPEIPDFEEEHLLDSLIALDQRGWVGLTEGEAVIPPALIEPGLDGIPARYRSEITRS